MRLSQAVEQDIKRPTEWKSDVISRLNQLVVIFLTDSGVVPPLRVQAKQNP